MECKWLPEFYEEPDWSNYSAFEERLYRHFRSTYIDQALYYIGNIVRYRYHPRINGKEEVFYHLTCQDYNKDGDRSPDSNRIVRINWPRAFIENYDCDDECCLEKPRYWIKRDRNGLRHKIFYENYLVILEERSDFYLFITGFYVEEEFYRRGLLKEYDKCKKRH